MANLTEEKAMAPHSSTFAWKIPLTEEPGQLQSMGSLGVGHDWATSLSLFTFMHWRRKWQATPVFLPGESQGWGSLVGCRLWGRTESDTTEATQQQQSDWCEVISHCSFDLHFSSSGHIWMWELDCEESWVPKNWCFWTVVLEKTLESPLDSKEVQPVHTKGDQSWVFIGKTDAKAETPILWSPLAKSWLIGKDSDAGRDWGQEEKGMTEDEMAGWHHWLDRHEFEWTPGVGDGQGGQVCCDSWGCKDSDRTEQLNWTELNNEQCWASFHVFVSHLYVFFWEMSV